MLFSAPKTAPLNGNPFDSKPVKDLLSGTRFEHISAQDLTTTLLQINQQPLKILDWQTPYQVMLTNLSKNSD